LFYCVYDILEDLNDIALLVTVLHEIKNKTIFIEELKRIVKDNGKIAFIEFHKHKTPMGPPIIDRIGKDVMIDLLKNAGFIVCEDFALGNNFYCLVFKAGNL
jgi:ubiquinone/menaquinone biosynthesis C-methylase UbiE